MPARPHVGHRRARHTVRAEFPPPWRGVVGRERSPDGGALVVLTIKIAVVRSGVGGRFLPYLGVTLFALLAVTWLTVAPDFLAGED